mgnify:CR=1 FL=1
MNAVKCLTALLIMNLAFGVRAAGKPVALVGDVGEALIVRCEITDSGKIRTEIPTDGKGLAPARWGDYAAVAIIGAAEGADLSDSAASDAARDYVKGGGTLILTGEAFARLAPNAADSARPLLDFKDFAAWKVSKLELGAGAVYCTTQSLSGVRKEFRAANKSLGEADDKGNYDLTEEGRLLRELTEGMRVAFASVKNVDRSVPTSSWGVKPLGKIGTLGEEEPVVKPPVFGKRPTYAKGLKVAGEGVGQVVVLHPRVKPWKQTGIRTDEPQIAKELAWHLKEMCPAADVTLRLFRPDDKRTEPKAEETTIFVANPEMMLEYFGIDYTKYPVGTSFLKRKGNWFLIGGEKSGRSHALTYLLEAMGCRYLWPSAAHHGKIIPREQKELFLPELDWTYTPAMKMRGVRVKRNKLTPKLIAKIEKTHPEILRYGWTVEGLDKIQAEATMDENPENRDFWKWHGVLDENTLEGKYQWGHSFTKYWGKYHETHPEFFALQPNGSRDQGPMLGKDKTDRCTMCLSNDGLAQEVAKNAIEFFNKNPQFHAYSLALNDGGPVSECMCEECRKLDPPNARTSLIRFAAPVNASVPYVRMTDRVMAFNNKVVALVHKVMPEKKFCFIAYNNYSGLPCAVRPDPALVVFDVAGDYTTSSKHPGIGNLLRWMQYGCESFWRPNLLWGFRSAAPQNYARRLFNDLETAKANNCVGTDFDCYYDRWAQFGFVYYMLASAMMNPDRLSFDDIANDYFAQAFGPAAPAMKKYYDLLEKTFNDAADDKVRREKRGFYRFQRHLDMPALDACLAEAKTAVKDDPLMTARVNFHAAGIEPARFEKKIVEAFDADDLDATEAWQMKFRDWIKNESLKDMPANNPLFFCSLYFTPCLNWLEWQKKENTKVVFDAARYNRMMGK